MLSSYLMLDLETTGGNPVSDRIIEIAVVRVEEGREAVRWSSLVNPGRCVSSFITHLTGIDNAMVADAPSFEDVAARLLELLEGTVLVAHNARFDHGFLKNAFLRMQIDLRVRVLCTVRLSRKLYPQHKGHGLDAIMRRHGLHSDARHRAMGDVDMVMQWLALAGGEIGAEPVRAAAQALVSGVAHVPSHLEAPIQDIPDTPGCYMLYGENRQPLYIGNSLHLRQGVLSHFQSDAKSGRGLQLAQQTRSVDFRRTAGALGARMLESQLVKQFQPAFNRRAPSTAAWCVWQLVQDVQAVPQLQLVHLSDSDEGLPDAASGIFKSVKVARQALLALVDLHGLCARLLGLEAGAGRCTAHPLGRCAGACCGEEDALAHRLRVQRALASHRLMDWPFAGRIGLREHDPHTGRTDIHLFDRWCHLRTVHDDSELRDALDARGVLAFDADTYQLLRKRLLTADPALQRGLLRFDATRRVERSRTA